MKLQNYINEKLFLEIKNNKIIIEEPNNEISEANQEKLKNITIKNLPTNVFAFSLDKNVEISTDKFRKFYNEFLGNASNIQKRCDVVLVCEENNNFDILICELKSTNLDRSEYEYQLMNVKVFVDYVLNLYKIIGKQNIENTNIYYILFHKKRVNNDFRKDNIIFSSPKNEHKKEKMYHFDTQEIIIMPIESHSFHYLNWEDLQKIIKNEKQMGV